jgi:hypothetical protein
VQVTASGDAEQKLMLQIRTETAAATSAEEKRHAIEPVSHSSSLRSVPGVPTAFILEHGEATGV